MRPELPPAARLRRRACLAIAGTALLYCAAGMPAAAAARTAASVDKLVLDADELDTRCETVLARLYARNPARGH